MAKITYPKGNIFDSSSQTLVNTVNCVGVMGKGIALEYKLRFPEMFDEYKSFCDSGKLQIGKLHLWKKNDRRWVLNFPTKVHYANPSEISFIEKGLKKFSDSYKQKGITSIAFPQLGSSLGGLDWDREVHPLMVKYLKDLQNLEVEIFSYDPNLKDNDFLKLETKTNRFEIEDFVKYINLNKNQAEVLYFALKNNQIKNSMAIHNLKGFGDVSLKKIKEFLLIDQSLKTTNDFHQKLPGF